MSEENTSVASSPSDTSNSNDVANLQNVANELDALESSLNEPEVKTYRVKIDGQEVDVTEDELLKGYQSTKSAQQRFSEAAVMRKQAEEFVRLAKSDPKKLLSHPGIGIDLKEFANTILREQIEEEMLSPEEKDLRDTKLKLARFEAERRKADEDARQAELDKYTRLYEEEYTTKIVSALESSGLPKTEGTVKKMASMMLLAIQNGLDVQPADVVEFVRKDYIAEVKSLFGSANEDIILSLLGEDVTNKVVRGHLNKTKSKQNLPPKITTLTKPASPTNPGITRTLSREDWLKQIEERARG